VKIAQKKEKKRSLIYIRKQNYIQFFPKCFDLKRKKTKIVRGKKKKTIAASPSLTGSVIL
jgi:hypothetical protein